MVERIRRGPRRSAPSVCRDARPRGPGRWIATLLAIGWAGAAQAQDDLAARLDALLARSGDAAQIGVVVARADTGQRLFARAADRPLKPASVLKLFTTSAALLRLGPDFEYQTPVFLRGEELWVIGSGDPAIGDERIASRRGVAASAFLDDCVRAVAGRRVRRIVLDDSIFDGELRHPSWPADQNLAWYQAPVGGLNYNDNCLDAQVTVAASGVSLRLTPPLPDEFILNSLRPAKQHKPVLRRDPDSDVFEFRGSVARSGPLGPVAVHRPSVFFGHALRRALESAGGGAEIEVVRRTPLSVDAAAGPPLLVHRTPLEDVLWRSNTFSQNLFAECLLKSLVAYDSGGRRGGRPGNWTGGAAVLRDTLRTVGVDLAGASIVDGSGLSHENRVTGDQIVALLVAMHNHPLARPFIESLAQPAQDGTLRNKRDPLLIGSLRAKTGTIRSVHALAGYLTRDDATLAFAVLVNGDAGADLPLAVVRTAAR